MIEKVKGFFTEVNKEMKKVSFPSRDELIGSTWVVLIAVVVMAVFLGGVDIVLAKVVNVVLR